MSTPPTDAPALEPSPPEFRRVGSMSALLGGKNFSVTTAGRCLAIFNIDGKPVATQGRCPHARGPLHEGKIENGILTCPWHGYEYDLKTGACDDDPELVLERYETRVDGDDILVKL